MNWGMRVLQTLALPLGYVTVWKKEQNVCSFFICGAGDEARTRYLHLGKVALYQMSYARKRKIDYTRESRICQPLRSTFFNFFSKEFR